MNAAYHKVRRKINRYVRTSLQWVFFPQHKKIKTSVHWRSTIGPNTIIGAHTNITGPIYIDDRDDIACTIGKYCLIGHNVRIRLANHSTDILNMQSAFQLKFGFRNSHVSKGDVVVGNNVWIGDNVILLPGVRIGNGAVVGAGSVVTKIVPDFAIFCGNPARLIKYRFDAEKRHLLKDVEWWNWDAKTIMKNKDLFNADIESMDDDSLKRLICDC